MVLYTEYSVSQSDREIHPVESESESVRAAVQAEPTPSFVRHEETRCGKLFFDL